MAIKKITNVFDHVSDATRILREIKLLRLLRHNGIVGRCVFYLLSSSSFISVTFWVHTAFIGDSVGLDSGRMTLWACTFCNLLQTSCLFAQQI